MEASVSRVPSGPYRVAATEKTHDPKEEIRYILDSPEFLGANPFAHPPLHPNSDEPDTDFVFQSAQELEAAGANFFNFCGIIFRDFYDLLSSDIIDFYQNLRGRWSATLSKLGTKQLGLHEELDFLMGDTQMLVQSIVGHLNLDEIHQPPNEQIANGVRQRLNEAIAARN